MNLYRLSKCVAIFPHLSTRSSTIWFQNFVVAILANRCSCWISGFLVSNIYKKIPININLCMCMRKLNYWIHQWHTYVSRYRSLHYQFIPCWWWSNHSSKKERKREGGFQPSNWLQCPSPIREAHQPNWEHFEILALSRPKKMSKLQNLI